MDKKYLLRFGYSHRYLKSFTRNDNGDIDDITTTMCQDKALHLELNDAIEYKTDLFKFFKPEIVEEGTFTIFIPTTEEYHMMHQRRLQQSSDKELCDEVLSRIDSTLTVGVLREYLGFCFGKDLTIYYTDNEKEVSIEEVFKNLKYGYKTFINGLTQFTWQCNGSIEVIELGKRKYSNYWIDKRYILDFKYNTPLEMLTDKNVKFPTTGYKEGFICEKVFFGNTHDYMERINGKTIIKPFKDSSFNLYNK